MVAWRGVACAARAVSINPYVRVPSRTVPSVTDSPPLRQAMKRMASRPRWTSRCALRRRMVVYHTNTKEVRSGVLFLDISHRPTRSTSRALLVFAEAAGTGGRAAQG